MILVARTLIQSEIMSVKASANTTSFAGARCKQIWSEGKNESFWVNKEFFSLIITFSWNKIWIFFDHFFRSSCFYYSLNLINFFSAKWYCINYLLHSSSSFILTLASKFQLSGKYLSFIFSSLSLRHFFCAFDDIDLAL